MAAGTLWGDRASHCTKPAFRLAVTRKRMLWLEGLWANAGEPVKLEPVTKKT